MRSSAPCLSVGYTTVGWSPFFGVTFQLDKKLLALPTLLTHEGAVRLAAVDLPSTRSSTTASSPPRFPPLPRVLPATCSATRSPPPATISPTSEHTWPGFAQVGVAKGKGWEESAQCAQSDRLCSFRSR